MDSVLATELVRALFSDSDDALFVLDAETARIVDANEAATRLTGQDRAALLNSPLEEHLRAQSPDGFAELVEALKAKARLNSLEGYRAASRFENETIPVALALRPFGDGGRALLTLEDCRARRDLEERTASAERELALILNTVPIAVWCAERDEDAPLPNPGAGLSGWHYRYLSPAMEKVTGWPLGSFVEGPGHFDGIIHPDDRALVLCERNTFLLSPELFFSMEVRLVGSDGHERWVRSDMQTTRDSRGRAVRLDGVVTDISRPKRAELSLRESQHWLSRLLETNTNGLLILDLIGRISFVNPAAEQLIGLRSGDLLDRDWNELPWHAGDGEDRPSPDLVHQTLPSSEIILERPDGRRVTVSLSAAPLRNDAGQVTGVVVTLFDISQRKRTEEALRANQERLSQIVEAVVEGLMLVNRDRRITFANAAAERLFQCSRQVLLSCSWHELPWERVCDFAPVEIDRRVLEGGETLVGTHMTLPGTDGESRTISASFSALRDARRGITGMVVSLTDDTARTRAAEAVRQSEERYRRLFERNLAGVCRYTVDGRYLDANSAIAQIFGYDSPADMSTVSGFQLYFEREDREAKFRRLQESPHLSNHESRRRRKDGSEIWVLENVTLISDESGNAVVETTLVDITERKKAEQTLARDHALLRSLLHSIPDFIFYKDRDGFYRGCNPAFEDYSGIREANLIGRKPAELFPPERAALMADEDRQVYATGKPLRLEKEIETLQGERTVELVLNPMIDNDGTILGLLGIGRDTTERRRLEEQLRQGGKMEAIGRLAGGVAHDFNNLLTIVLGNLSLVRTMVSRSDSAAEPLADCERAAQRAAELTNQLLGFARRSPVALAPIDLSQRVAETVRMLRRTIDPRVTLEVRSIPELWAVEADAGQISQVLMNLCLNARDAMPDGGRILIETHNLNLSNGDSLNNLDARGGEFVRLRLQDDGHGIPPEVRARIFEPFFTTKPFGKGTGLGLAVVFGIVRQHRGWIECHSAPNRGTRFDIYLPRTSKNVVGEKAASIGNADPGHETILLVDDEPMIRELGRAVLGKQGYRVLLAEDGSAAVDLYRQHGEEIDLVILDLSMPNMSGKEALSHLRVIDPDVRVLFASGYSTDQFEPGELESVLGFISKPYRAHDLHGAVREALDRTAGNKK